MTKNSPKLDRKKGLYLKHVETKGRGVFCAFDIRAGETLEISPCILLNERSTSLVDRTILGNYTFVAGTLSKEARKKASIKKASDASSIIMGIMSFCNHGEKPNAEVLWEEVGGTLYHTLRATRKIPKHTEICTTYGAGWFEDRK